jgi:hypothetical protein
VAILTLGLKIWVLLVYLDLDLDLLGVKPGTVGLSLGIWTGGLALVYLNRAF